jgi:hypothetical protein
VHAHNMVLDGQCLLGVDAVALRVLLFASLLRVIAGIDALVVVDSISCC